MDQTDGEKYLTPRYIFHFTKGFFKVPFLSYSFSECNFSKQILPIVNLGQTMSD